MNKAYKCVYNAVTGAWVAVSELATSKGKTKNSKAALVAAAVLGMTVSTGALAQTAPINISDVTDLQDKLDGKVEQAEFNTLADQVAAKVEQTDFDSLTSAVAAKVEQAEFNTLADQVAAKVEQTDFDSLTSAVAAKVEQTDFDSLTSAVATKVEQADFKELADKVGVAAVDGKAATGLFKTTDDINKELDDSGLTEKGTNFFQVNGTKDSTKAVASGESAVAIGIASVSAGAHAIAVGTGANANGVNSIAAGNTANSSGANSIATGSTANASGANSIATGNTANASGANSIATGNQANASGENSIATGNTAKAIGAHSIATGNEAVANGAGDVSIGNQAGKSSIHTGQTDLANTSVGTHTGMFNGEKHGGYNTALGNHSGNEVTGSSNTAVGSKSGNNLYGSSNIAMGDEANNFDGTTKLERAIAIGKEAKTNDGANDAIAMGSKSEVGKNAAEAIAIGMGAKANSAKSIALGQGAIVESNDSIAIGSGSQALQRDSATQIDSNKKEKKAFALANQDAYGQNDAVVKSSSVVSFGHLSADGKTEYARRLIHVAAGVNETDAVNVAQLKGIQQNIETIIGGEVQVDDAGMVTGVKFKDIAGNNVQEALKNIQVLGAKLDLTAEESQKLAEQYKMVANNALMRDNSGTVNVGGGRLVNVASAVDDTDAVNYKQLKDEVAKKSPSYIGVNASGQNKANENGEGAQGVDSVAIGVGATATAAFNTAVGHLAQAGTDQYDVNATAIGYRAKAAEKHATAVGDNARALAENSTAMGVDSWAEGKSSIAIGDTAQAKLLDQLKIKPDYAIAIGKAALAANVDATAIGHEAHALGEKSNAMGYYAEATGKSATAIGSNSEASAENAMAAGTNSTASGVNSIAQGTLSKALAEKAIAVGFEAKASGVNSIAQGTGSEALAENSTAVGKGAKVDENSTGSSAFGAGSSVFHNSNNAVAIGAQEWIRIQATRLLWVKGLLLKMRGLLLWVRMLMLMVNQSH